MMTSCEACNVDINDKIWQNENLNAHKFPTETWQADYLKKWLKFCHIPPDTSVVPDRFICSRHFSSEDYFPEKERTLKSDATPHLNQPTKLIFQFSENDCGDSDTEKLLENVKSSLCRLCGKTKNSLFPIYEFISTNERGSTITVAGLIEAHLPLKVSQNDALPLNVCFECSMLLQQWHAMYTTCQAADLALQKIFCQKKYFETESETSNCNNRENFDHDQKVNDYLAIDYKIKELQDNLIEDKIDFSKENHLQSKETAHSCKTPKKSMLFIKKLVAHQKLNHKTIQSLQKKTLECSSKDSVICELPKRLLFCNYCYESFDTLFKKKQHLEICRETPSICETCGKFVKQRKNIALHQKKHKLELICDRCGSCCRTPATLESHLVKVHNEEPKSVFCCQMCCKVYYSISQYRTHIKIHEAGKIKKTFNYEPFHKMNCTPEYICFLCESGFDDKMSLIVHLNTPKKLKCSTCQEDFSNERTLANHNGRQVFCQFCNKAFCVIHLMKAHERTHTKEKPFKCKVCSNAFRTGNQRDSHETIHAPPMFECTFCHKKFRYKAGYLDHLNYHSGNLVSCKLCNRKYGGNFSLLRHMRRYHNKPNTCIGRLIPS